MADYYDDDFEFEDQNATKNKKQRDLFQDFDQKSKGKKSSSRDYVHNNKSVQKFSKGPSKKKIEEDNDYGDDFEDQYDQKKNKKNKNDLKKSKTVKNVNKSHSESAKLSSLHQYNAHRYAQEVEILFPKIEDYDNYKIDRIHKLNGRVRDTIKTYSQHLDNLINKKMQEYNRTKNTRKLDLDEELQIMKEEIKNNEKYQQRLQYEVQYWRKKQSSYKKHEREEDDENIEMSGLKTQIKIVQKDIYQLKLDIHSDARKLTHNTNDAIFTDKDTAHISQELTVLKNNIGVTSKQFSKNQQKLDKLEENQSQLLRKIQQIQDKDKEADRIIQEQQKRLLKDKKYVNVKKRLDNARNHNSKTISLWETKSKVLEHENEQIKMKLKNMELQVKNFEDSINQSYDKSMKTINKVKENEQMIQNKNVLKGLQKIRDAMKVYSADGSKVQREMTRSQFSKVNVNKISAEGIDKKQTGQLENKKIQKSQKHENHQNYEKYQKNQKDQKENSQYGRIWKDQDNEKSDRKNHYENQFIEAKKPEKQQKQQQKQKPEQQKEQEPEQKKKPFNLRKNRITSEQKFELNKVDEQKSDEKETKTIVKQQKNQEIEKSTVPKRFNLRKSIDRKEEGYQPSNLTQNKKQQDTNTGTSKPSFNLKRRHQGGQENVENEFIKESSNSNPYVPRGI